MIHFREAFVYEFSHDQINVTQEEFILNPDWDNKVIDAATLPLVK